MSVKVTDNSKKTIVTLESLVRRGLDTVGGMAETYAKQLAPVDTGNLRNSIAHQYEAGKKENSVVIGTDVEYAPYVELGTVKKKARPFLRPAIENHIQEYKRVISAEFKRR